MTSTLSFEIAHTPVPWMRTAYVMGRPINPAKLKAYEAMVRWEAVIAMKKLGLKLFEKPVTLEVAFWFETPKSWSKKKADALLYRGHPSKPDLSNLVKAVEDGMIGVVYVDDALISSIIARKQWAPRDAIIIKVYPSDL